MKIGINASFARKFNTGIGQVTVNYLKALDKNIKNNEYFLYLEEELEFNFSSFKKRVFLPLWRRDDLIRKIWWEKFLLPKKIKEDGCEEFLSLYQCPTIISKKIKHTMVVHDIVPKLFPEYLNNFRKRIYWSLTERAIKKADKIIAISEHTKNDLMRYLDIPENKIEVRYIDVDNLYKREIPDEEVIQILEKYRLTPGYIYNAGGLDIRKNIKKLIEAYEILLKKNGDIPTLVISGKLRPGMDPLITDAEKIIKEKGIEDKVRLLDFVPQEDMPALSRGAKIFFYPSLYEGFGLTVLEAMNVGIPVVTAKVSSIPEIGGSAVKYFDPKDSEDMAAKINELLNDEGTRNKMIAAGKIQAQKFSWEKFIK